ncbi:hypothetical protein [Nannocystis pusilla]|uniref:hypothetical protein n=1 Tax=Nannocystis pusilla TaxID=889268 RepID=UPI003B7E6FDF
MKTGRKAGIEISWSQPPRSTRRRINYGRDKNRPRPPEARRGPKNANLAALRDSRPLEKYCPKRQARVAACRQARKRARPIDRPATVQAMATDTPLIHQLREQLELDPTSSCAARDLLARGPAAGSLQASAGRARRVTVLRS